MDRNNNCDKETGELITSQATTLLNYDQETGEGYMFHSHHNSELDDNNGEYFLNENFTSLTINNDYSFRRQQQHEPIIPFRIPRTYLLMSKNNNTISDKNLIQTHNIKAFLLKLLLYNQNKNGNAKVDRHLNRGLMQNSTDSYQSESNVNNDNYNSLPTVLQLLSNRLFLYSIFSAILIVCNSLIQIKPYHQSNRKFVFFPHNTTTIRRSNGTSFTLIQRPLRAIYKVCGRVCSQRTLRHFCADRRTSIHV